MNTYPKVLLGAPEMAVLTGILDGTGTVFREFFPMSRIVLGKTQEGVYCLLVVLVALDLNHHLLQPKDDLVAALLWHFVAHEVYHTLLMFSRALFILFRGILKRAVPQVSSTNASAVLEINATYRVVELILCSPVRCGM